MIFLKHIPEKLNRNSLKVVLYFFSYHTPAYKPFSACLKSQYLKLWFSILSQEVMLQVILVIGFLLSFLTHLPKSLHPDFHQNHPWLAHSPLSSPKYVLFASLHQSILAPPQYIPPSLTKVLPVAPETLHRHLVTWQAITLGAQTSVYAAWQWIKSGYIVIS